ncbi:organic cation/carnitine transporter, putative [Ixodes scapularis]|uniref:Organic cation/carnitine transporter, putative n=1 Tax=Ixodes scapularis TaxID=6945 RepID=B7Q8Y1_IXOSC|nr:organic cation/carnitine transporter, putative [Ixodes scapularis]|eukprot:XP_002405484.1 organic cation/carnitine transporter, putative [Ixodes scapularis]
MDIATVLEHIGDFGKYQLYVQLLTCLPPALCGAHQRAHVFLAATPEHRCYIEGCDNNKTRFHEPWASFAIPEGSPSDVQCFKYSRVSPTNSTCLASDFSNISRGCDRWIYATTEFEETIVTEFNIVCKDEWLVSFSQSLFMLGVMVSAVVFGHISDRYGRRISFLVVPPIFLISAWATVFTSSYAAFTSARFITAIASSALFQTSFVLAIELIGPSHRLLSMLIYQMAFPLGECFLAISAYYLRTWRTLEIALSIPVFLLLPYYWLLPESFAWCLYNSKHAQALDIINKAARWNGKPPVPDMVGTAILPIPHISSGTMHPLTYFTSSTQKSGRGNLTRPVPNHLTAPALTLCRLVNAMVYYGLSLSAEDLAGSTYKNFIFLALIEFPGVILSVLALRFFGRRYVLSFYLIVAGIFCAIVPVVPDNIQWLTTTLVIIGKCNISASFAVIYLYSAEVFPTSHRNTGIGIGSMSARLGTIAAPFVASDLGRLHPIMPMIVFGSMSLLAGVLTLTLPETRGQRLPQTIEEAESLGT